jgi:hypothetical protein
VKVSPCKIDWRIDPFMVARPSYSELLVSEFPQDILKPPI